MMLAISASAQVIIESEDSVTVDTGRERDLPSSVRVLSPVKATMMAAAFPGLGQVYNRKYWKIPLVYAGFGALGYSILFNSQNFDSWLTAYQDLTDDVPETISYEKYTQAIDSGEIDPALGKDNYNPVSHSTVKDQMLNAVSYYRRYRDLSYIGVAVWYIVSILDANVDAIMSDYDISPELNLSVEPVQLSTIYGPTVGLGVKVTF
jgi:hypothetical protein